LLLNLRHNVPEVERVNSIQAFNAALARVSFFVVENARCRSRFSVVVCFTLGKFESNSDSLASIARSPLTLTTCRSL
jgi:hypothetical protein